MEEKNKDIVMNGQQETVLFQDACQIIDQAQAAAYRAVDVTLIKRNWLLGLRIQHEVLKDKRAEYGEQVVKNLANKLTDKYGKGFSRNNLYRDLSFYKSHPDIFHAVSGKSEKILQSLTAKFEIVPPMTGQSEKVPSLTGLFAEDLYYVCEDVR